MALSYNIGPFLSSDLQKHELFFYIKPNGFQTVTFIMLILGLLGFHNQFLIVYLYLHLHLNLYPSIAISPNSSVFLENLNTNIASIINAYLNFLVISFLIGKIKSFY